MLIWMGTEWSIQASTRTAPLVEVRARYFVSMTSESALSSHPNSHMVRVGTSSPAFMVSTPAVVASEEGGNSPKVI